MKLLWKAISDKLRADATLVSNVGFNVSTNRNIVHGNPPTQGKTTGVFFIEDDTNPVFKADTFDIRVTEIWFHIFNTTDIACGDSLKAVEDLFANSDPKLAYLNISNTDIHCNWSRIRNIYPIKKEEKTDCWHGIIVALFHWSYK